MLLHLRGEIGPDPLNVVSADAIFPLKILLLTHSRGPKECFFRQRQSLLAQNFDNFSREKVCFEGESPMGKCRKFSHEERF